MKKKYTDSTLTPLLASAVLMVNIGPAEARDYFDPGLLTLTDTQAENIDLSVFETSGTVPPGEYMVSVYINQTDLGQYSLVFAPDEAGTVVPELTPEFLDKIGVNIPALSEFAELPQDKPVASLAELIPQASATFDFAQLRLDLSIPQIAMKANILGTVDPEKWDNGVPALMLSYMLNGGRNWQLASSTSGSSEQTNLFANLNGGLNYEAWRLRSNMVWTYNESEFSGQKTKTQQKPQFSNTYLQRDITALRSEFLIGENSTASDVFDSIPFRGFKINSSDDMLPDRLRGFAPVVEGIAQSNARVTVSQNGNVIYQTFVAPGPFRITDLAQTGQGGDLTVTITEADGTVHSSIQAVSSIPVMRRPGSLKYEFTAGQYNGAVTTDSRHANFLAGTAIYGFPHDITLYGGGLVAEEYASVAAGVGVSLGNMGAVSTDMTTSSAQVPGKTSREIGNSYRIRYAKSLLSTGTSIDLAAYRYSEKNYYTFSDYNNLGYTLSDDQLPWALARQRSNFQVRVGQRLGSYGSFYLSASRNDYWGDNQVMNTVSAGYNSSYRGVSFGMAYSIDRVKGSDDRWPEDRQFTFNVQVPLSLFSPKTASFGSSYATYQALHSSQGTVQQQAGISGNALDSRLSYGVMQSWSNDASSHSSTLNLGYQGSKGNINSGYSYSAHNRSLNMGASGAMVIHPEGVTLSQMLGSSVAIVSAPGTGGTRVMTGNVYTDSKGRAVLPYLSSYQGNAINLDPSTLPDDVDLPHSSVTVYPTKGAVVMAKFKTRVGYQALFTLSKPDGSHIPFGAAVTVNTDGHDEHNTGITGDAGQVYLSGLPERGTLFAKWGTGATQQCRVAYDLKDSPVPSANNPVRVLDARCQ